MLVISGETGVSFPKVVNIIVREGLIHIGKIPEDTSLVHLLVPRPYVEPKKANPKLVKLEKHFKEVKEQWPRLSDASKKKHEKMARELAGESDAAKSFLTWLGSQPMAAESRGG